MLPLIRELLLQLRGDFIGIRRFHINVCAIVNGYGILIPWNSKFKINITEKIWNKITNNLIAWYIQRLSLISRKKLPLIYTDLTLKTGFRECHPQSQCTTPRVVDSAFASAGDWPKIYLRIRHSLLETMLVVVLHVCAVHRCAITGITKRPSPITTENRIPVDWNFVDDKDLGNRFLQ
jgi:hypothetical protein